MGMLSIERVGGPGFGGPHLKSRGQHAFADLGAADQAKVVALFEKGDVPADPGTGDVFQYRITRQESGGARTIQVPERLVPPALIASVKDTIE